MVNGIELVRQLVEQVWNTGKLDLLEGFYPNLFTLNGDPGVTLEDLRSWENANREAFPDVHFTINDLFSCGERVVLRWTAEATHTGTLWGEFPPTHRRVTWNGMHIFHIREGRICEMWSLADHISRLQQLGISVSDGNRDKTS